MTEADARAVEQVLAEIIRRLRAQEITPLRQRIAALERDLAISERLARLERHAGNVEARLIRPESWRNGGDHARDRRS